MKALMTIIVLSGAPMLLIAPDAQAHERYAKHHYHEVSYFRGHMPRWLARHRSFRSWYRHSGLHGNRYLGWDELFSIYRWEARFSNHRRFHRYDRGYNREYRYYSRYWNDRHHNRDRHRYGDHKRGKYYWKKRDRHYGKKRDKRRRD